MMVSGVSPNGRLVEVVELRDHPFFVASQFHPEFRSRPSVPHPLFRDFVGAVCVRAGVVSTPADPDAAPAPRLPV
jgi:CTP synthase